MKHTVSRIFINWSLAKRRRNCKSGESLVPSAILNLNKFHNEINVYQQCSLKTLTFCARTSPKGLVFFSTHPVELKHSALAWIFYKKALSLLIDLFGGENGTFRKRADIMVFSVFGSFSMIYHADRNLFKRAKKCSFSNVKSLHLV